MSDKLNSQSFAQFVEGSVIPLKVEHPDWIRLDGATSGGNRSLVGHFRHWNRVWRCNADSHFKPLMLAYEAFRKGEDPFEEELADERQCLVLKPTLRSQYPSQFKHMYLYEV